MKSVYCAVRTESLNKAVCASSLNKNVIQMIDVLCLMFIERACKLRSVHNVYNTALVFVLLNRIVNSVPMAYVQSNCVRLEILYR